MASEDTAVAEPAQEAAPSAGDTAGAESQPSEQTEAQGRTDEGADESQGDEGKLLAQLPPELRKRYNQIFTQKSQAIAEQRKRFERYEQLISSLESDPAKTVQALAQHLGLPVQPPPAPAEKATDEVLTELAAIVGEDEAKRLAPAFEKLAKKVLESEIQPIRQQTQYATAKLAHEQTQAILKSFGDKHPGWEKHEPKMMEIAQQLQPNGMDEATYLETLYKLATYDIQSAEQTKRVVEKLSQAAQAAENVAAGVNASRVSPVPKRYTDPDEAFTAAAEAAKKGIAW